MGLFKKKQEEPVEEKQVETKPKHGQADLIYLKDVVVVDREAARLMNIMTNNGQNGIYKKYLSTLKFEGNEDEEAAFLQGFNFAILMLTTSPERVSGAMMVWPAFKDYCESIGVDPGE